MHDGLLFFSLGQQIIVVLLELVELLLNYCFLPEVGLVVVVDHGVLLLQVTQLALQNAQFRLALLKFLLELLVGLVYFLQSLHVVG